MWHLQPSPAAFWGDTVQPGPPRAEQNQCSPKDQTGLKTWLGRAAWVMKSLCQGNPPVPAPALPWNRGDSCRGESPRASPLFGEGIPTTGSYRPPSLSPSRKGFSHHQAFATGSCLLVTERVTGWQRKSESGKYLVPGLIQDVEPTILTQLMACGLRN